MSHLNAEQIANYAYRAGFRGHGLTTAVAVALAESGGNTKAHNAVPPDNSYGLWQINMLDSLGPARRHEFHIASNNELFHPQTNARAAHDVYRDAGGSFGPWSTYTNGAYRQHIDKARRAAHHATATHDGHKPAHKPPHKPAQLGGQGGTGDYSVDTAMLHDYASGTRTIATALTGTDGKQLAAIGSIAEHSFGRIGKDSGFAEALHHFGTAMHHQVNAIGTNAENLAKSVGKIGRSYDQDDHELAKQLLNLLD